MNRMLEHPGPHGAYVLVRGDEAKANGYVTCEMVSEIQQGGG